MSRRETKWWAGGDSSHIMTLDVTSSLDVRSEVRLTDSVVPKLITVYPHAMLAT